MASFDGTTDAPALTLEVNPSALSTFIGVGLYRDRP